MVIKKARLHQLNELINEQFRLGNQRFEGQIVEVLVDGTSKTHAEILSGYTKHNKLVNFAGSVDLIGSLQLVRIRAAKTWSLDGDIVDE